MTITRVHHLNCGTMRPLGRQLSAVMPRDLVAHCLLVERPDGLTLVDTGIGVADVQQRAARLGRAFMLLVGPVLDPAETASAQVSALGFAPGDVTDIVLTHLDPDHSGGLADFPHADGARRAGRARRGHAPGAPRAAPLPPRALVPRPAVADPRRRRASPGRASRPSRC